jgi:site-specific recombinase XerD
MLSMFSEPSQIKGKDIAAVKYQLRATLNMANRCLSLLRSMFAYWLEQQLCEDNPAIGIKRFQEKQRECLINREELLRSTRTPEFGCRC